MKSADRYAEIAEELIRETEGEHPITQSQLIDTAQVYATLALASATQDLFPAEVDRAASV